MHHTAHNQLRVGRPQGAAYRTCRARRNAHTTFCARSVLPVPPRYTDQRAPTRTRRVAAVPYVPRSARSHLVHDARYLHNGESPLAPDSESTASACAVRTEHTSGLRTCAQCVTKSVHKSRTAPRRPRTACRSTHHTPSRPLSCSRASYIT